MDQSCTDHLPDSRVAYRNITTLTSKIHQCVLVDFILSRLLADLFFFYVESKV